MIIIHIVIKSIATREIGSLFKIEQDETENFFK